MKKEQKMPKRKNNRLDNYDYSTCGAYFLTICTANRENHFWNNAGATIGCPQDVELSVCGKIVEEAINNISVKYPMISVEQYAILPDHVHLLLLISSDENGRAMHAPTVSRVVQQLKGYVTKRIGKTVWQKLFFDHVIRSKKDYEEHAKYIYENPMLWKYKKLNNE